MNDQQLIQQAKSGCNNSFATLIKNRGEKLYKVAYCYVKDEALALEVVSEATYKSYISIGKLEHTEYFDTWLVRIVMNEALDVIRKRKRLVFTGEVWEEVTTPQKSGVEDRLDLYEAIDQLKEDEKEILTLKYFGDLTFEHIARQLGKPENTIKTKHYRALDKVKAILEGGRQNGITRV
ncbi:DNA-directed RNA polymerase sigma-70 factor [Paenibacillus segetis]|uniref:DNA-directed RNA polymerase sigma-70 factor n=2 Tax=Paenibacillus segetis TaxID=1325360 RepID=A0ABQ1Y4A8_9BACL|nr:DNA-directed RNA polymerase sigma-70 factor [Paenibacillus segetis]